MAENKECVKREKKKRRNKKKTKKVMKGELDFHKRR